MNNEDTTYQLFIKHLKAEISLFKKLWWQLIPTIILLYYFGMRVGRTLAFSRHVPGPTLKDLGFDIFPKEDYRLHSDIVLGIEHFLVLVVCVIGFIQTIKNGNINTSVFGINIWRRYLNVITIGHFLRICTYMSTSLPGPADHCKVELGNYNPPDHWYESFYVHTITGFGIPDNCGDLIFSGHMLQMMTALLTFNMYSDKVFSTKISLCLKVFAWLMVPLEVFFIISGRQHYTVDMTVAIYTTILLWIVYTDKIHPNDQKPFNNSEEVELQSVNIDIID